MALRSSLDLFCLTSSFFSFLFFLGIHMMVLRHREKWPTSQVVLFSFGLGALVDGAIFVFVGPQETAARQIYPALGVALCSSLLIYSLLFFHYLAWVFGMGEAAIRIRLLRELENAPSQSATLKEIYAGYDAEKMLEIRLSRLTGSGHLFFDGQGYSINHRILLLQSWVMETFQRLLGSR